MLWEEKIDVLKKKYSPSDLRVPFYDWSEILKSIERQFIKKEEGSYSLSNWADRIKKQEAVVHTSFDEIQLLLEKLNESQNYWIVLPVGQGPTAKQMVYDCKPSVILELASLSQSDFFVVDKKYAWFTYFNCDRQLNKMGIYKSGVKTTPFEKDKNYNA